MSESENKLQSEIVGDAERRAKRLIDRARRDVAKELDEVRKEHEKRAAERLQEAQQQAEDRRRAISAGIEHEIKQHWLSKREERLDSLFADLLKQVEKGDSLDREESLHQLLVEALTALGPTAVTLRANSDCATLLDNALVSAITHAAWGEQDTPSVTVLVDDSLSPGVVVESADKRRLFDNTYTTRLARLHADLRARVAETLPETQKNTTKHD